MEEFNKNLSEHGITLKHHMPESDGVYMKEVHIPSGKLILNHKHTFTHKSILASGTGLVQQEGAEDRLITGPYVLTIEKGVQHCVIAVTDVIWFCVHATNETDEEKIDHSLVGE